jgi:hypothetical protein
MFVRDRVFLIMGCCLLVVGAAQARNTLTVRCTGEIGGVQSAAKLAPQGPEETDGSPELYEGTLLKTNDGESFQCTFFVPADYDTTGDPPEIRFMGWVPPAQACGVSACTAPNDLRWRIYWRTYVDTDLVTVGEANNQDTNTEQLSGETCGGGYCFVDEYWTEFSADITDEAVNMSIGDLIVIRPERYDDTDDYAGEFYVWPIAEIDYPD